MTQKLQTEILIVGGGASGVCAAIQAARMGAQVILVEETPWLGGMLTAAGVSAIDGNHHLPSGLWGEFRTRLRDHYGGPRALKTGWVSHTQFEPRVGDTIFKQMVAEHSSITVHYGYWPVAAQKQGNAVCGADFVNNSGDELSIDAQVTIDATEYGDVLAMAGCEYRIGREAQSDFDEPFAPEKQDRVIQDLSYTAILKEYDPEKDRTIQQPPDYDPEAFDGMCKELAADPAKARVDCTKMLEYGRLPNNKIMLNWPIQGNDAYADYIDMNREQRQAAFQTAKNFTLSCLYHMQTRLKMKHLGLADDEYDTPDRLPYIPYIREARRLKGVETLRVQDVVDPYQHGKYAHGIAVGDYPLDHHHDKAPERIDESYPDIPAFNVPYGCLVPEQVDGLLVAEKSISVTHIVNGCTRLQPVVMQLGQAAGASAALCVRDNIQPRAVNVCNLQQVLLDAGMWLMPFADITPQDPAFQAVQRTGLQGLFQGKLLPRPWENQMLFQPDKPLTKQDAMAAFRVLGLQAAEIAIRLPEHPSRADFIHWVWVLHDRPGAQLSFSGLDDKDSPQEKVVAIKYATKQGWLKGIAKGRKLQQNKPISRKEAAILLDRLFDPSRQDSE
ncbi:FAD-dependent oxidoreductase [candidate division KSB1 bacterium]|nr:FAD-dependent oxidoreductase [candidate division KSB1 bacterium]